MADKRLWAKVDRNYFSNPKTGEVLLESPAAVLLHLWSILYSAQMLTDGVVPERVGLHAVNAGREDADMLVAADMWHRAGHDCPDCPEVPEGKAYVHDYLEHQDPAQVIAERSRRMSAGGAKGGKRAAEAKAQAKAVAHPVATPKAQAKATPQGQDQASSKPSASLVQAEREIERENTSSSNSSTEFDAFWSSYPRRVGKVAAQKAFVKALKSADVETIMSGVESLRIEVAGKDPKFTPHPATWLNEGRWEDEPSGQLQIPTGSPWDPSFHRTQGAA
ncbi:hypothetical protein ABH924_000149 [Arthrobacter sp. GAS37]|uniref:hypothetical protein n=1 Tax=Arthrobacter sp. GAS37 TaxID=3156261 RepID=UPI003834A95A